MSKSFRILCLDGGGSKGIYTLGALSQIEAMLNGTPIHEHFSMIYGTSTGSIIAAALAIGKSVDEIITLYTANIPQIMTEWRTKSRTAALENLLYREFKDLKFDAFKTFVGIVATSSDNPKPVIFKSSPKMAHGMKSTFKPGFNCLIADAVRSSCSAYPLFSETVLKDTSKGTLTLIDGGFVANNPSFFALTDALKTEVTGEENLREDLRFVSIGTGQFGTDFVRTLPWSTVFKLLPSQLLYSGPLVSKQLEASAMTMEILFNLHATDILKVRINDANPKIQTSLLESRTEVLDEMQKFGVESVHKHETELNRVLFE